MSEQRSRLPTYTANGTTFGYNNPLTNRRNSLSSPPPSYSMFSRDYYHHLPSPSHHIMPSNLSLGPMIPFDNSQPANRSSSFNNNNQTNYFNRYNSANSHHYHPHHHHNHQQPQNQNTHHHPHFHNHHHPYNSSHSCHSGGFTSGGSNKARYNYYRSAPSSALTSPRCSIPGTPNNAQFKLESPFIKSSASTPSRVVSRQTSSARSSKSGLTKSSTVASVLSDSSGKSGNSKKFEAYMPLCEVQSALKKGEIIEGVLRINPKNFEDAYISAPGGRMDIYIAGVEDRNRAFNGDKVAVALNPPCKWKILYETLRVRWKDWGDEIDENLKSVLASKENDHSDGFWPQSGKTAANGLHNNSKNNISSKQSDNSYILVQPQSYCSGNFSDNSIATMINDLKRFHCNLFCYEENPYETEGDSSLNCEAKTSLKQEGSAKKKKKAVKEELKKIPEGLPIYFSKLSAEDFIGCPHWEEFIQKTGHVKAILSEVHPRLAGGKLKALKDDNRNWALFCPTDSKIPRMLIPLDQCPRDFVLHPNHYENTMFIARLESWQEDSKIPIGALVKKLGCSGDINVETEIILTENGIDDSEFDESILTGLPVVEKSTDFIIPNTELLSRRSFHDVCVFTIDPSTARDLDDAISIRIMSDCSNYPERIGQLYEVGVHIADVSYFLKEGLPCDEEARKRTTSFYLVQKMIPMLPRVLCERLCSLNPGEDKLTFSVVWVMDIEGNTYGEPWFGRSIIQSCSKLSYEIAQDMIDEPDRNWKDDELPPIYGNKWIYCDISASVNIFMRIARSLRKKRLDIGALNIQEAKLAFVLDPSSGLPLAFTPHKHLESHFLIEEFMLMANMAVAKKIYEAFPEHAFLRRHEPPDSRMLKQFQDYCKANGMKEIDISSSKTIQLMLNSIDDSLVYTSLSNVLLRSLSQAKYFCAGAMPQSSNFFRHYALSADLYTHFTSPIRRYPDVIVHRLLAAALNCGSMVKDTPEELQELANVCNIKKNASRLVSTASGKLFVALYIKQCGIVRDEAVVVQIYDHSFDVMCMNCNEFCRVYCDKLEVDRFEYEESVSGSKLMKLYWKGPEAKVQTIAPFARITVDVSISPTDIHKWIVIAVNPFVLDLE